jgi:hypothetical protein
MPTAVEKHFHPEEVAEIWGVSKATIRRVFEKEPGVLLIGEPSRRVGRALRRGYFTMRIPQSVVDRVHQKMTGTAKRP